MNNEKYRSKVSKRALNCHNKHLQTSQNSRNVTEKGTFTYNCNKIHRNKFNLITTSMIPTTATSKPASSRKTTPYTTTTPREIASTFAIQMKKEESTSGFAIT